MVVVYGIAKEEEVKAGASIAPAGRNESSIVKSMIKEVGFEIVLQRSD